MNFGRHYMAPNYYMPPPRMDLPIEYTMSSRLSDLKSSAPEFTPGKPMKLLSAAASDFSPAPPLNNANLNSNATAFELLKITEKIAEFVPEKLPDEKYDEPIFVIKNREIVDDENLEIADELINVDVKNCYSVEDILDVFKRIRSAGGFEEVPSNIKNFSSRAINAYKAKNRKKNKEGFRVEREVQEIVSSVVWRKPLSEEEEKIIAKAKIYKAKLTGTKEEHEQIKRKIKITLNKLSPTNLDKLKFQLLEIGKESSNSLIFLVQCIFEKAWSEVKYTQMYATLCKFLKDNFESNSADQKNQFKYELLEKCENAFTQGSSEELSGLSSEEIEEKKQQLKKKTQGNVRFIGELFKVGLITSKVVLGCVDVLVGKELDEDKLEGACILLSTGGSIFDRSKVLSETNQVFKRFEEIMSTEKLSSKVKFKIMDLIDERKNKWKKNFKEEVKTVQEIHEEFELEMQRKRRIL